MKYISAVIGVAGFILSYLAIGDLERGAGGMRWAQMIIGGLMMIGGYIIWRCMAKEKAAVRTRNTYNGKR